MIQLHPGLNIEISNEDLQNLEEATDPVTGRTFMRVTLKPDTEIKAIFQPRLARLALSSEVGGVPFGLSGYVLCSDETKPPPPPPPKEEDYPKWEPYPKGSYTKRVPRRICYLTKASPWGYVQDCSNITITQLDYP